MVKILWNCWANIMGYTAGIITFLSGIPSLYYPYRGIAYYAIIVGLMLFVLEWPKGENPKGRTEARFQQKYLSIMVDHLGPIGHNFYGRAAVFFIASCPCYAQASTYLAGFCCMLVSGVYVKAAYNEEEWVPIGTAKKRKAAAKQSAPQAVTVNVAATAPRPSAASTASAPPPAQPRPSVPVGGGPQRPTRPAPGAPPTRPGARPPIPPKNSY